MKQAVETSAIARLDKGIGDWLPTLNQISGWDAWKRKQLSVTLWYDDPIPNDALAEIEDFVFPKHIDLQHQIVTRYYALQSTLISMRDCQYYFRRYPFNKLPVLRYDHLRYTCEAFFGRVYEFSERMKELFEAVNKHIFPKRLNIGPLIRQFKRISIQNCERATGFTIIAGLKISH